MTERDALANEVELTALDGTNPLGFLAALGTFVTLCRGDEANARLLWVFKGKWLPLIVGASTTEACGFSEMVARGLRGREVAENAEGRCSAAQRAFEAARKAVTVKKKEITGRGITGKERIAALEQEVRPLEIQRDRSRREWLEALSQAVPRRELALGKRLDCTSDEYRQHAAALGASARSLDRDPLDLLAAFGSDACVQQSSEVITPTPFQFIKGSGHQDFLETVVELIKNVSNERVQQTLFEAWTYSDEKLSMRWDPVEDRRYALMDRDPTASDNRSCTVWMANLLAYRSLAIFPAAAQSRGLAVTGWSTLDDEPTFTWPIWEFPASLDVIRSLLQLRELTAHGPNGSILRARGVMAVFRARRIKVGAGANYKLNFTPAAAVWVAGGARATKRGEAVER